MPFKIGDRVIHPAYGTGQIVNIKEKQFSGKSAGLYYEVVLPKLITLWVPIETQEVSRLRLVTTKSELNQPSDLPIITPVPINTTYPQRPSGQVNRLKEGPVQRIRKVMRNLLAWGL